jgi:sulfide:quinone oxidoreductase
MTTYDSDARRVLITGGGPAALETALALQRLAGDRVAITLMTPNPEFVYRPLAVAAPFGGEAPRRFSVAALAADRGFALRRQSLAGVNPERRTVHTAYGATISYDALVLAIGARPVEAIPGAMVFRGPADAEAVRGALSAVSELSMPRVAFAASAQTAWTLPLYELALLTAAWAQNERVALEPWLITHEPRPLALFGAQASADVAQALEDAGVRLWTSASPTVVEDGRLWLDLEGGLPVDLAIALPRPAGHPIPGIPHDAGGFVPVDGLGRVAGLTDVYAVGDMTARTLKQGGLATQQADATATALAAWAGADVDPEPYRPQLRGVLLTGGAPRYLRRLGPDAPSEASDESPWWPPHKIAARHLGPYLAAHPELEVTSLAGV